MGSILRLEKIGALSEAAEVVTLQPSILNIGGQQYHTGILTRDVTLDVTLVAHTRYQIYAVVVGGVVALRASANENSAGPSGFNSWKLVASFYANASADFGKFVNIRGRPSTEGVLVEAPASMVQTTGGTPPGNGSEANELIWRRDGDILEMDIFASGSWGSNGSSGQIHLIPLPTNLSINTAKQRIETVTGNFHRPGNCGAGNYSNNNGTSLSRILVFAAYDATRLKAAMSQSAASTANMRLFGPDTTSLSSGFNNINARVRCFISGWSNTAIEDL